MILIDISRLALSRTQDLKEFHASQLMQVLRKHLGINYTLHEPKKHNHFQIIKWCGWMRSSFTAKLMICLSYWNTIMNNPFFFEQPIKKGQTKNIASFDMLFFSECPSQFGNSSCIPCAPLGPSTARAFHGTEHQNISGPQTSYRSGRIIKKGNLLNLRPAMGMIPRILTMIYPGSVTAEKLLQNIYPNK